MAMAVFWLARMAAEFRLTAPKPYLVRIERNVRALALGLHFHRRNQEISFLLKKANRMAPRLAFFIGGPLRSG
jgi:hypothetical protein